MWLQLGPGRCVRSRGRTGDNRAARAGAPRCRAGRGRCPAPQRLTAAPPKSGWSWAAWSHDWASGAGAGVPTWAEVGPTANWGGAGTEVLISVGVAAGAEAAEAAAEPRQPGLWRRRSEPGPRRERKQARARDAETRRSGARAGTARGQSRSRPALVLSLAALEAAPALRAAGPAARLSGQPGRDAAQLRLLHRSRRRVPIATVASLALAPPLPV